MASGRVVTTPMIEDRRRLAATFDRMLDRPRDATEYRRVPASVRQGTAGLNQLTSVLLNPARADADREGLSFETLDVERIVDGIATTMQPLAQAAGIRWAEHAESAVIVAGDPRPLTQLFVNLIDKGLEHIPAGGSVTLTAWRHDKHAIVSVCDTGASITVYLPIQT